MVQAATIAVKPEGPWEIFESPVHGKGLRVTKAVTAGTVILSEEPLLQLPSALIKPNEPTITEVLRLTLKEAEPEERKTFLSLHNCFAGPPPPAQEGDGEPLLFDFMTGTFATNARITSNTQCGVFEILSRVNHSCTPNCVVSFSQPKKLLSIRALVPLTSQTELTISYIDSLQSYELRQQQLFRCYRFRCACVACKNASGQSELRRRRVQLLRQVIGSWRERKVRGSNVMSIAKEVLGPGGVLEKEGLLAVSGDLWRDVCAVAASHSSFTQTKVAATNAQDAYAITEGDKGLGYIDMRTIAKDPRRHSLWNSREHLDLEKASTALTNDELKALVPDWDDGSNKKKRKKKKKKSKKAGTGATAGDAAVAGETEEDEEEEEGEITDAAGETAKQENANGKA